MTIELGHIYEILKLISIVLILIFIAIKDIREYRIPNKLLILAISIRTIIFIAELIQHRVDIGEIKEKLVVVLLILVIGIITNIITHNGIGLGDIKLLMTVALYIENSKIIEVIFNSIFIMGIIAIILLIAKRKRRKDIVPFAPAILIAVLVTGLSYL